MRGGFTHGLYEYFHWWVKLSLTEPEHTFKATVFVWAPCLWGTLFCAYCIHNSVRYDPEVRIRPYKRAWHQSEHRIANASKYRHSSMTWAWPKRFAYIHAMEEKMFEEIPIPRPEDDVEEVATDGVDVE